MTTGEKIRMYREIRKVSQVQLAKFSNINVGTIRKYELGIRNPKPDQLIKIANGLGINVSVFYDLNISTGGDVMALLFMISDITEIEFIGQDENGKFPKNNVAIKFKNSFLKKMLSEWAEMKKNIDEMSEIANKQADKFVKENTVEYISSLYDEFKLREMDNKIVINSNKPDQNLDFTPKELKSLNEKE